jgi:Domain of unknown function (DUF4258)
MYCKDLFFSRHAFERMFQRGIAPDAVAQVVASGEIIADYPDDQPFPSALLLGFLADQPVHAVVAHDPATDHCYVVTIYRPDPEIWDEAFKKRRA